MILFSLSLLLSGIPVYRASFDNGATFSDEINILEDRDFIAKGIKATADSAYLVFSGDEVYFMKVA